MTNLRFGMAPDQNLPFEELLKRWRYYESLGLDSLWVCDHFNQPSRPTGPYFESWTTLAGLAAGTDRVRIGVLVSSNTFRHPALLAQEAITVDHISNGRLDVGIGAGWFVDEHQRFGIALPAPGERVGKFDEAVQIIDALLCNESTTFDGRYYQLTDASLKPRPIQTPRLPLTLAGHKRRMLGICARYADCWNSIGSSDQIADRNQILDEQCARIGRDPREIRRGIFAWASQLTNFELPDPWESQSAFEDVVARYQHVGVTDFILDQPTPAQFPTLEKIARDVLANRGQDCS